MLASGCWLSGKACDGYTASHLPTERCREACAGPDKGKGQGGAAGRWSQGLRPEWLRVCIQVCPFASSILRTLQGLTWQCPQSHWDQPAWHRDGSGEEMTHVRWDPAWRLLEDP